MKEYKLIVRATWYTRGTYYFYSRERAEHEKKRWEHQGFRCTIEEVKGDTT